MKKAPTTGLAAARFTHSGAQERTHFFNSAYIYAVLIFGASGGAALAAELTTDGKSDYVIYVASDAIPAEQTAAKEFQQYVQQISGALLPIVREKPSADHVVYIGSSAQAREKAGLGDIVFKPDEIALRALPAGGLVLMGDRPRGTLYAVYTMLEDYIGVRWWTSREQDVPANPTINFPDDLNNRFAPPFGLMREAHYGDMQANSIFAVRMKNSALFYGKIPEEWGSENKFINNVHSMFTYLPPAKYFAEHPEWYAQNNGTRRARQLCLTNREMRKTLIEQVKQRLATSRPDGMISVSQMDDEFYCTCPECTQAVQRLGGQSGLMLDFVNEVAAAIEPEFPRAKVETLAYQYTRRPPTNSQVKPRHNVIIRLCSIEADFARPLNSPSNADFSQDVIVWQKIAPELAVWNYTANFLNYMIPHPNLKNLGKDLQFLAANHVKAVFEQGDIGSGFAGDFTPLRTWLLSKLLWNPAADQEQLTKTFLTGYYGPAATAIGDYLQIMQNEMDRHPETKLRLYMTGTESWLSLAQLQNARRQMDLAQNTVKDNEKYAERVRRARISCDLAWLQRTEYTRWAQIVGIKPQSVPPEFDKLLTDSIAEAGKNMFPPRLHYAEGRSFERLEPVIRENWRTSELSDKPLPKPLTGLPPSDFVELPLSRFVSGGNKKWYEAVTDPAAATGTAIRFPGTHNEWCVKIELPQPVSQLKLELWASVRCEGRNLNGNVLSSGIWNPVEQMDNHGNATGRDCEGKEYRLVKICDFVLRSGAMIYLAPVASPDLDAVYVDRMIVVRRNARASGNP